MQRLLGGRQALFLQDNFDTTDPLMCYVDGCRQDDDVFAARAALARLAHVQSHINMAANDKRILDAVNRLLEVLTHADFTGLVTQIRAATFVPAHQSISCWCRPVQAARTSVAAQHLFAAWLAAIQEHDVSLLAAC